MSEEHKCSQCGKSFPATMGCGWFDTEKNQIYGFCSQGCRDAWVGMSQEKQQQDPQGETKPQDKPTCDACGTPYREETGMYRTVREGKVIHYCSPPCFKELTRKAWFDYGPLVEQQAQTIAQLQGVIADQAAALKLLTEKEHGWFSMNPREIVKEIRPSRDICDAIRRMCEEFGDCGWDQNTQIVDVLENHLLNYLRMMRNDLERTRLRVRELQNDNDNVLDENIKLNKENAKLREELENAKRQVH